MYCEGRRSGSRSGLKSDNKHKCAVFRTWFGPGDQHTYSLAMTWEGPNILYMKDYSKSRQLCSVWWVHAFVRDLYMSFSLFRRGQWVTLLVEFYDMWLKVFLHDVIYCQPYWRSGRFRKNNRIGCLFVLADFLYSHLHRLEPNPSNQL